MKLARVICGHQNASKMAISISPILLKQSRTQPDPVRLLGVGVSGFRGETVQQGDLFANTDVHSPDAGTASANRHVDLDRISDEINQRFGRAKIHRGRAKS